MNSISPTLAVIVNAARRCDDQHVGGEDYYSGGYLQDVVESDLLKLGGQELLAAAHAEAGRHVDEHHPWDGRGDEPAERVSAYLAVLWQVAEAVRIQRGETSDASAPPTGDEEAGEAR